MKPFTLFVNGEELHAPVEMANAPLAAFLKTTRFKVREGIGPKGPDSRCRG